METTNIHKNLNKQYSFSIIDDSVNPIVDNDLNSRFLAFAFLASVGAALLVFIFCTMNQHKVITFMDGMLFTCMVLSEFLVIGFLLQTFNEKRNLIRTNNFSSCGSDSLHVSIHLNESIDGKKWFWYT